MPNHNEAGNGLERSRDTKCPFLYGNNSEVHFLFFFTPLCGLASLLAYGKRHGDGCEKYPQLLAFFLAPFIAPVSFSSWAEKILDRVTCYLLPRVVLLRVFYVHVCWFSVCPSSSAFRQRCILKPSRINELIDTTLIYVTTCSYSWLGTCSHTSAVLCLAWSFTTRHHADQHVYSPRHSSASCGVK